MKRTATLAFSKHARGAASGRAKHARGAASGRAKHARGAASGRAKVQSERLGSADIKATLCPGEN